MTSCASSAFMYCWEAYREKSDEKTHAPHHRLTGATETVRQLPSVWVWALAVQMPPAIRRGSHRLATGTNQAPTAHPGFICCMLASNTSAFSRTRRNQRMKTTRVASITRS